MDFVTIIEIGAVSLAVGVAGYQSVAHAQARAKLGRTRAMYEDAKYMTNESATQLCGGCGLNLTPDQIASCTGESCPLYLGNASSPLYLDAEIEPGTTTKKINIGYTGSLHTLRPRV